MVQLIANINFCLYLLHFNIFMYNVGSRKRETSSCASLSSLNLNFHDVVSSVHSSFSLSEDFDLSEILVGDADMFTTPAAKLRAAIPSLSVRQSISASPSFEMMSQFTKLTTSSSFDTQSCDSSDSQDVKRVRRCDAR